MSSYDQRAPDSPKRFNHHFGPSPTALSRIHSFAVERLLEKPIDRIFIQQRHSYQMNRDIHFFKTIILGYRSPVTPFSQLNSSLSLSDQLLFLASHHYISYLYRSNLSFR
ncbi:hypothetical protein PGT21_014351 [Puccinia graminis f. sp. tritici]|uniref:Uncharacterized protein n=1 Tax=Puccinia graminis f. sp. tritici TaxID=56615 RepID=A0A5B0MCA8_PUCGR|nr:hypothetical protein PGT21_014351 [Puccinia graminis f. sp. tritici]